MRKNAHWLEEHTEAESIDFLTDLAGRILDAQIEANIGFIHQCILSGAPAPATNRDLPMLSKLVRAREYRALCEFELDYSNPSLTISDAKCIRQAQALFQKLEFLDVGVDRSAAARVKFEEAEALCNETNILFRQWKRGSVSFPSAVEAVFHGASRIISDVLGEVPSVSSLNLRLGPGATTLTKKRDASAVRKFSAGISCSEELIPWAARLLAELPHITALNEVARTVEYHRPTGIKLDVWSTVDVAIHLGSVSFVPKNYKTYRPTETQPSLNGLFQLGIGDEMSRRLLCSGLNLANQGLNRQLAKLGSLTGALATLDLSSASDTIATELVAHLLPVDWFSMLNAARVGKTRVPWSDTEVTLQKFSAMGNGFTFPLESLIFWALSLAVVSHLGLNRDDVNVYGDDIICPVDAVPLLRRVLTAAGFLVNNEKSFWSGPFRESCGADYLRGIDIRPVYVKSILTPAALFALHNGLYRRGERAAADYVRKALHPSLQLEGPDGYGDGHLLSENWKGRPHNRHRGFGGWIFDSFSRIPKSDTRANQPGERLLPTYSIYRRSSTPLIDEVDGLVKSGVWSIHTVGSRQVTVLLEEPGLPIPLVKGHGGELTKCGSLPGDEGYKKISIYTLHNAA